MAAFAPVGFLLGEEEEMLITTLDTEEMVVNVKKGDGSSEADNYNTLYLAGFPRVTNDHGDEDHLNNGKFGDGGHRETNTNVLDFLGGLGFQFFFGITRHFIIY